ncbi:magnesium protoporphyrin IX methyltransferase [Thermaurantiacus sp.]
MATAPAYTDVRDGLRVYFDRTARNAWVDLTSDAPVSRIRKSVRAGRARMRETLLSWLPADLSGARILDAGCGTGALAHALAARGAEVVGVDIAPGLIAVARERTPPGLRGRLRFEVGDMLDPGLGTFDHAVFMDSLIHYPPAEMVAALGAIRRRTAGPILATFAPKTALLSLMHALGRAFPRGDRSPAIVPVEPARLKAMLRELGGFRVQREARVASAFYTSHALEWVP